MIWIAFCILSALILVIWITSFIRGLRELNRETHITPVRESPFSPRVSIIIPARNEEKRIKILMTSIEKQNYKNYEVIVVDDNSEDNTVAVVESFSGRIRDIKVIKSPLREGWCGKNSALVSGFNAADPSSRWILFIDADCELMEDSLTTVVDFAERRSLDCLSLFPRVVSERFFERLLLPSVGAVVTLFNSPEKVNDPSSDQAFLNGQFILIRRAVYEAIGTHEVVKDAVLEDAALAAIIKRAGYRLFLGFGEEVFLIRMYETFSEFIDGWTKNLFLILGRRIGNLLKMILITVLLSYIPFIWLITGIYLLPHLISIIFFCGYFIVLFFQMYLRHKSRTYPLYALLAFISSTILSYIAIRSAYRHLARKGVEWKGRVYFSNR